MKYSWLDIEIPLMSFGDVLFHIKRTLIDKENITHLHLAVLLGISQAISEIYWVSLLSQMVSVADAKCERLSSVQHRELPPHKFCLHQPCEGKVTLNMHKRNGSKFGKKCGDSLSS